VTLRDIRGAPFELNAYSLSDLSYKLRVMIDGMAASAKADIAVMVAKAKGETPRYWKGLRLA
jgi:hypothetical protein